MKPVSAKVIFFAPDGMRPDLMDKFVATGDMPAYRGLIAKGVKGDNGLVQAFPPNTGVGWYTLATGTYPSEHGATNTTFFRSGDSFNNSTAAFTNGVLQTGLWCLMSAGTSQMETRICDSFLAGRKVIQNFLEYSPRRDDTQVRSANGEHNL